MKKIKLEQTNFKILYIIFVFSICVIVFLINIVVNNTIVKKSTPQAIFNGDEANIEDYPFVVLLFNYSNSVKAKRYSMKDISSNRLCTAVVIDKNWILTAAHCIKKWADIDFGVLVGFDNLSTQKPEFTSNRYMLKIKSSDIFVHKDYKVDRFKTGIMATADLALLKVRDLPEKMSLKLAKSVFYSQPVTALGWGFSKSYQKDEEGFSRFSDKLQKMDATLYKKGMEYALTDVTMGTKFGDKLLITPLKKYQSAMPGDSGGPLITTNPTSGEKLLLGIYSSGTQYTSVTKYIKWINETTGKKF